MLIKRRPISTPFCHFHRQISRKGGIFLSQKKKEVVVGLTGQTGAGKSTLTKVFTEMGYAVIDADKVARTVSNDPDVLRKLCAVFGDEILTPDGALDRRLLAAKTFSDKEQLEKLNAVMYPPIIEKIEEQIKALKEAGEQKILLDAPTLFESGAQRLCDCKVSVLAAPALRKERIMRRDGLSSREADDRMSAQHGDRFYILRSDYIIRNNGSEQELLEQGKLIAKRVGSGIDGGKRERGPGMNLLIWTVIVLACILAISGAYKLMLHGMYPQKYQETVSACAQEYGVDENLVYAVIKCESGFRADAVSKADARGLMQITKETFDWVNSKMPAGERASYDDIFDPDVNIRYGTCLLSLLLEEFDSTENALTAYHAGWGNVKKWLQDERYSSDGVTIESIPFPTTSDYVDDVLQAQKAYESLYS